MLSSLLFKLFVNSFSPNIMAMLKFFVLIMWENMLTMILNSFSPLMVLFIKPLVHKHLSKMVCLSEGIVISLIWLVPFFLELICLNTHGEKQYLLHLISLIVSLLVSFKVEFLLRFSRHMSLFLLFKIFLLVSFVVEPLCIFPRTSNLSWNLVLEKCI